MCPCLGAMELWELLGWQMEGIRVWLQEGPWAAWAAQQSLCTRCKEGRKLQPEELESLFDEYLEITNRILRLRETESFTQQQQRNKKDQVLHVQLAFKHQIH